MVHSFSEPAAQKLNISPKVGIVIVHYKCLEDTFRCMDSLRSINYKNFFIILVDGGSSDGSGRILQRHFKNSEVTVIIAPDNRGFAASSNIGIITSLKMGAELVWLLNPDTEVAPSALNTLIKAAEDSLGSAAVFGSKVLYADMHHSDAGSSKDRIWGAGGTIDFTAQKIQMCGNKEEDSGQYEQRRECDYIPGCSMLIPSSIFDVVGYLPEEFFMYFEETDWCVDVKKHGFPLFYEPSSVVWHYFDDSKMQTPATVYYYNRNQRLFWFRHGTINQKLKLVFRTALIDMPKSFYAFLRAPDALQKRIFKAHLLSCVDFVFGRFGKRSPKGMRDRDLDILLPGMS